MPDHFTFKSPWSGSNLVKELWACRSSLSMALHPHQPNASTTQWTTHTFEVVHSDLTSPMQTWSIQGSVYTATYIDNHSKLAVVYFLKSKDQSVKVLEQYLAWGETQMSSKLCALHSD